MSTILGILSALVIIIWGIIRKRPVPTNPVFVPRYIHPGHTWTRMTADGDALVGIDDFAQTVLGRIDTVGLPRLLHRARQGQPVFRLAHGKREVEFVSPLSGRVIEKNEMVMNNPSLVNSAPYGDGWLVRIRPARFAIESHNLFAGKTAHQFIEQAKEQLVRLFSGTPALMYQDGGIIIKDLSDRLSDDEWNLLVREFFCVDPEGGRGAVPQW